MKKSLLVVVALLVLVVPLPGHAAGCSILGTGSGSGTCTYTAGGPGEYKVVGVSGYRIEVISPPIHKRTLVAHAATEEAPASGVVVATGALETEAGDVVAVAITIGKVSPPVGDPLRYQDGYATANDV